MKKGDGVTHCAVCGQPLMWGWRDWVIPAAIALGVAVGSFALLLARIYFDRWMLGVGR